MNPENSNKRKKAYDSTNDDPGSIDNVSNRQVYVGGISWNCDEQDIKDEFSTVGEVSNVRLIYDHDGSKHKGYGFITFKHESSVQLAINKLAGKDLKGRIITVNVAVGVGKNPKMRFEGGRGSFNPQDGGRGRGGRFGRGGRGRGFMGPGRGGGRNFQDNWPPFDHGGRGGGRGDYDFMDGGFRGPPRDFGPPMHDEGMFREEPPVRYSRMRDEPPDYYYVQGPKQYPGEAYDNEPLSEPYPGEAYYGPPREKRPRNEYYYETHAYDTPPYSERYPQEAYEVDPYYGPPPTRRRPPSDVYYEDTYGPEYHVAAGRGQPSKPAYRKVSGPPGEGYYRARPNEVYDEPYMVEEYKTYGPPPGAVDRRPVYRVPPRAAYDSGGYGPPPVEFAEPGYYEGAGRGNYSGGRGRGRGRGGYGEP